jgi:alpha-ketoglutarate-dependent taurine dioxygenase
MGTTSAQLDVVDLTPRIGSEIRTDLDTLLSGRESENIRATLEQRGVVFFRGLDISDAASRHRQHPRRHSFQ